jgi:hypothetical protein
LDETGYMTFSGIESVQSGTYTIAHGTQPGVAVIYAYPQDNPPALVGELTISFGDRVLRLRDCLLDSLEPRTGGTGTIVECRIKDRRWKWQNPVISGRYNVYQDDGLLDFATEKTPQQLAALCFEALGETGFQVGALPNDGRPTVDWNYASAAQALDRLCDEYGCRVILDATDTARIVQLGVGAPLPPNGSLMSGGTSIDPPETPSEIIATGPCEFQFDFPLRAIGRDVDDTNKPIDSLTYKPADGWGFADVEGEMLGVDGSEAEALAAATVYRWYQIEFPAGGFDFSSLGFPTPLTLRQHIELLPYQVETQTGNDGIERARPPVVYGVWFNARDEDANEVTEFLPLDQESDAEQHILTQIQGGFSLDLQNHIVRFGFPVFKQKTAAGGVIEYDEPDLRLRIGFRIRRPDTFAVVSSEASKTMASGIAPPLYVSADYLKRKIRPEFAATTSFTITGVVDNEAEFRREAELLANGVAQTFQTLESATATFEEILAIGLDGAIQQITWSVDSNSTAKTTVQRNNDVQTYLPSYRERRLRQVGIENARALSQVNALINAPTRQFVSVR